MSLGAMQTHFKMESLTKKTKMGRVKGEGEAQRSKIMCARLLYTALLESQIEYSSPDSWSSDITELNHRLIGFPEGSHLHI